MYALNKINFYKLILFLSYISLLIGYLLNENSSGGSKIDFLYTLPYVKKISENYFLGIELLNKSSAVVHFHLHYSILALFIKVFNNTEIIRIIFLHLSILIPIFFYKSLGIKYGKKVTVILAPVLIFLSPYFRSSAIWPTTDNTALIFFIITVFFFLKIINKVKHSKYAYFDYAAFIFFFLLSSLTRQYYIIFFIYFFFIFYKKKTFENIKNKLIYIIIFLIIIGYIIYNNLLKIKIAENFLTDNIFNNIYINLSILFFYLFPFIFLHIDNFKKFKNFFIVNKNFYFLSSLILIFLYVKFNYSTYGGGFYFQLFNNYLTKEIFFIISLLGFYILYYFIYNNINNLILVLILFSIFNYKVIYQKYFDPLFIIIFFTLFKHSAIDSLIKNINLKFSKFSYIYIFIYFFLYFLANITYRNN
jgi:hypothetical protein